MPVCELYIDFYYFINFNWIVLAIKDLDEIERFVDEKIEKKTRNLPTKDELFTKMDEVIGELKTIRESIATVSQRTFDHENRITNIEKKILRAIINGQSALKQDLLEKINAVVIKVDDVKKEVIKNGKRIEDFGLQLAVLSDDAPTIEEFYKLDKRVSKVEQAVASS